MPKKKSQADSFVAPQNKEMRPHLVKGLRPPFYQLGQYTFQDLCSDLFAKEPSIEFARVFGENGQRQYGIDILADRQTEEKEVGQCKGYEIFRPKDIREASDEFFKYWDGYWNSQNVIRFILFVGCEVKTTQTIKEIENQKVRFQQFGIKYELWDASHIERKLSPHIQIVSKYCYPSEYWVPEICGITSSFSKSTQVSTTIDIALISLINQLASQYAEKELTDLRTLWQVGNEKEVLTRLEKFRKDRSTWENTSPELKAKILCFTASILVEIGENTDLVENMLDEAHNYIPIPAEKRVHALLLVRKRKLEAGIALLENEEDKDTQHLRIALLLYAGQNDIAIKLLSDIFSKGDVTAETYRLMALYHLTGGDLVQAQISIEQAIEKEPTWFRLEIVQAIIAYYSGLSPVAIPKYLETYPLPVGWILVNQNQESIASLRRAEEIFAKLEEIPYRATPETHFEAWRLACLLNDAEKQEEAILYCKSILKNDPTYFPAIIWITFRELEVDLEPTVQALEEKLRKSQANIHDILGLTNIYEYRERYNEGIRLLQDTRQYFIDQEAHSLWSISYIRFLIHTDGKDELENILSTLPETEEYLPAHNLIMIEKNKVGDVEETFTYNMRYFQETHEPEFLINACMTLYQNQRWSEFTGYSNTLIEFVGTASIYIYSILGAFYAQQYEFCLELIDRWKIRFQNSNNQNEFSQVRISCLRQLGKYSEALVEAKILTGHNPSITNILILLDLYYELGNYDALARYAEDLKATALNPESLLDLARMLRIKHKTLAQYFWRKAMAMKLPDQYVGIALDLSYKLGLEHETEDLFPRLLAHDKREGQQIREFHTKVEFFQVLEELGQQNARVINSYRSGELPIHFIAEQLNIPLSDLFHDKFKEKQLGQFSSIPLYIRYGGRPVIYEDFPEPISNLRLFIDITGLLLATHLGIMDLVEQAFAPLYIPSEIFTLLNEMVNQSLHHQPSRIEANKSILELISRNRLKVLSITSENIQPEADDPEFLKLNKEWVLAFAMVRERHGYLLDFLPLTQYGEVYLTEPISLSRDKYDYLLNCRTLADVLLQQQEINQEKYNSVIHALGTSAEAYPNLSIPKRGSFILCHDSIVELLAESGLLEVACNMFDLYITESKVKQAQGVIGWDKARQDLREWLYALQNRLREGIDRKRYIALPLTEHNTSTESLGKVSSTLMSIISQSDQLQETDAVWIDDRFTTHFSKVGKAPILSITEILKYLVGKKLLSQENYFDCLIELRGGNVRYIPLEARELLYHLKKGLRTENGNYWIEDTTPLRVLEKYLGSCVIDQRDLQFPPVPTHITNPQGEIEFVLNIHQLIQDAFYEIWTSFPEQEICIVLSNWIIEHLYLDYPSFILGVREERFTKEPDYYRAGSQLTSFLSLSYSLRDLERISLYEAYDAWVISRIVGKRLFTEPPLLEACANVTKQRLLISKQNLSNSYSKEDIEYAIYRQILMLPPILRNKLEADEEFLIQIGADTTPIVTVEDIYFSYNDFWQAVTSVINGKEQTIYAKNVKDPIRFYPQTDSGKVVVCIAYPNRAEAIGLDNSEFHILISSKQKQEEFLKSQRPTFDYSDIEFEKIVHEITSMDDPVLRLDKLLAIGKESAVVIYRNLANSVKQGESLDFNTLSQINFQSLCRYLRFDANKEKQDFDDIAKQLIQEVGIEIALHRLSSLPCKLPQYLLHTLDDMETSERVDLLTRRMNRSTNSIISTVHLLRLLFRFQSDTPLLQEGADRIVRELFTVSGKEELEAFINLLTWTHHQFLLHMEFAKYPVQIKIALIWTHTHYLFSMMKNSIDHSWIKQAFSLEPIHIAVEMFLQEQEYENDISHPRFINHDRLLLTSILYMTDGQPQLLASDISEYVIKMTFPNLINEIQYPSNTALLPTHFLSNISNTFLNRNVGFEIASTFKQLEIDPDQFTDKELDNLVADFLNELLDKPDEELHNTYRLWSMLFYIVPYIQLPKPLGEKLAQILEKMDWVDIFSQDYDFWRILFSFAIKQNLWLKSDLLREQIQIALREIAKLSAKNEYASEKNEIQLIHTCSLLIEGALRTATISDFDKISLEVFGNTLVDISSYWKKLGEISKRVVLIMAEELPLQYSQQLWSTLVRLRTL